MTGAPDRRDLVLFGTNPFSSGVPLGDWQLARALAQTHRVLWVDPPASPIAPHRGVASNAMYTGRPRPVDGLLVGAPIAPSGRPLPRLAGIVERLVTTQVNRWTAGLGMVDVDAISFAPRLGALRGLRRRRLVAWLKDRDWAATGVARPDWLRERQRALVRRADGVAGVSTALVDDCRELGVSAVHIPNGCDVERFGAATVEPAALRDLPRPLAVFAGAWNDRVDVELLRAVCEQLPTMTFLLLGAVRAPVPSLPNVCALGPITYDELPAYLQAADVGLVPYRASAFNAASCPLKVYEYLAAGRPVVASAVDVAGLDETVVRRRDSADAFAAAVWSLARRDVSAACRAVALESSWDTRATALLELVDGAGLSTAPSTTR